MTNIGIDIMGGDSAPKVTLEGSAKVLPLLGDDTCLHLIGPEEIINDFLVSNGLENDNRLKVIHAPEAIGMDEHPVKALQQKKNSSMAVGFGMLALKKIDGFASAGNSGAVMVGALNALKPIEGVMRPCVVSAFPQKNDSHNILVDVGINVDAKPEMLVQFAKLGEVYARLVYGVENPRIGLLNTGEEEGKGSLLYQKAHELLRSSKDITFVGNLEARDFYDNRVDVTVCDGFTGNVFLKQAEAFYNLLQYRDIKDPFLDKFNYERYGGTPILGVNGNVVLGHGVSGPTAIANMILATEQVAKAKLSENITKVFKN